MELTDEKKLEILRDEYKRTNESIARDMSFVQQGMVYWTTAAGLLFAIGWKENLWAALLAAPFPVFFLVFHSIFLGKVVALNSARAATLENQINEMLGERILLWESELSPKYARSADMPAMIISLLGSLVIVLSGLGRCLTSSGEIIYQIIAATGIVISVGLILFAFKLVSTLYATGKNGQGIYGTAKMDIEEIIKADKAKIISSKV